MRIKVVTSINVRSSPFTSPRTATQDDFPEPEGHDAILEKVSPAIRSRAPGLLQRMDRLIASQRIPHGSRLSGWLHGSSVRRSDGKKPPVHARKTKTSHTSTYCFAAAEQGHQHQAPGIRSYPSTRGVIDPVHSPTYGPRQLTYGSDPRHAAYLERLRAELGSVPLKQCSKKRHGQKSKPSPAKNERVCFPQIKDLKLRQKMIGCVFFGTLLTILLTTCKSSHPGPSICRPSGNNPLKTPHRPRPRHLRIPARRHLPRRLHLLHPPPHHPFLPLPDPPLHARLRTPPDPLRPQMQVTPPRRRRRQHEIRLRAPQTTDPRRIRQRRRIRSA